MTKNILFDTEEKAKKGITDFGNLMDTAGWKLLVEVVNENIDIVTERILVGSNKATKEDMDRLRDKLTVYKEIINTPEKMIKDLTVTDSEGEDLDPYPVAEKVEKKKT